MPVLGYLTAFICSLRQTTNLSHGRPLHLAAGFAAATFSFLATTFVLLRCTPGFLKTILLSDGL